MSKKWDKYFIVSVIRWEKDSCNGECVEVEILVTDDFYTQNRTDSYEDDEFDIIDPILKKYELFPDYECLYRSSGLEKFEEIKDTFKNDSRFIFCKHGLYALMYNLRLPFGFLATLEAEYKARQLYYLEEGNFYIKLSVLELICSEREFLLTKNESRGSYQLLKGGKLIFDNIPVEFVNKGLYVEYSHYIKDIYPKILRPGEWIEE